MPYRTNSPLSSVLIHFFRLPSKKCLRSSFTRPEDPVICSKSNEGDDHISFTLQIPELALWSRVLQLATPCSQQSALSCVTFHNMLVFTVGSLLALRPTHKLQDHPLSALRDCLFSVLAATLHIWGPSPPS
jgi:hypothetical protein